MKNSGHPLFRSIDYDGKIRADMLGSNFFPDLPRFDQCVARPRLMADAIIEMSPSSFCGGKLFPVRDQTFAFFNERTIG
jgi:hypothetical protein